MPYLFAERLQRKSEGEGWGGGDTEGGGRGGEGS